MGILQKARLLSINEICRSSQRISVVVPKSIQYAPPENPPFMQEFYGYYKLLTLNSL